MMGAVTDEAMRSELAELVREFPPAPIGSEADLARTQARVDELLGRDLDDAEELFLDLLGTRIEQWEEEREQIPDISGVALIRVLLEERGLRQRDLVEGGVFPTESVASEVLAGRRALRLEHLMAAAGYFGLSPAVFLPARELEPA